MLWLKILAVLAALFVLFCRTRLGLRLDVGDIVSADATVGFLRFRVVPSKGGTKRKKPKKAKGKKEPEDVAKALKKFPRPTLEELKSAYHIFLAPTRKALLRLGRGIRIHPLNLSVTLAGRDDPARAAETYGRLCAAMWMGMPVLEELIDIPKPALHVEVDYEGERTLLRGEIGISLRVGTLLSMGFGVMLPGLRWLWKFYRAHKNDKPRQDKQAKAETPKAAA